MTSITTVQLRNNLAEYVDRLLKGESFNLTYRKKQVAKLQSTSLHLKHEIGSGNAIIDFINNRTDKIPASIKNDPRPLKEIYDEMRQSDIR
jgi:antitoxin (DNA-binding transcriptional repressor) of toxin-antitoxin stability system